MPVEHIQSYGETNPRWMLEIVKDPAQDGQLALLLWNGQEQAIADRVAALGSDNVSERVYRPIALTRGVLKATRFPTQAVPYGTNKELLEGLCAVVKRYTGLCDSNAALLALSAIASWVAEFTEVPVCRKGACVGDDPKLQGLVAKLLCEQEIQMPPGAESELNSAVLEALLGLCHQPEKQALGVAEITAASNEILENRGELVDLKPRAVRDLLRNLGFPTKRLGAERRGFTLLNSVRKRIHDLALSHKLLDIPNQSVSCSLCEDMFPLKRQWI